MTAMKVGAVLRVKVVLPPEPPVGSIVVEAERSRMWKRVGWVGGWVSGWIDPDGVWRNSLSGDTFQWSDVCDDAPLTVVSLPEEKS